MFHEGDLQSGISLAIQQQKTVACFVRDAGEASKTWEDEWLRDEAILPHLEERTVLLRLESGSQEASFLAAFCPVDSVPSLVFIQNGQLRDNIQNGESKEGFVRRLLAVLGVQQGQQQGHHEASSTPQQEQGAEQSAGDSQTTQAHISEPLVDTTQRQPMPPEPPEAPPAASQPPNTPSTADTQPGEPGNDSASPPSNSTSNLQSLFPGRTTNLEANHARQQATERERLREVRARHEAEAEAAAASSGSQSSSQPAASAPQRARVDYAAQQRRRIAAAKTERERVMAAIENDKAERRERERARKEAQQATMSEVPASSSMPTTPSSRANSGRRSGAAGTANIQVRLFSGRTLRDKFPATATLAHDVRRWVDAAVAEDAAAEKARMPAYVFKQILNPLPSRTVEVAEEGESLLDLGLLPSATLVLVEVQGGAEAYAGNDGGLAGLAYSAASGAYGLFSGTVGAVAGGVGSLLGWGGGSAAQESGRTAEQGAGERTLDGAADEAPSRPEARGGGPIKVRTLADQREDARGREGETWYNGNQTSFQPKPKDDSNDEQQH